MSPEDILAQTRSKTTVTVSTMNFPTGDSSWEVELPNNRPDLALLYNNTCHDLVAAALAKLGVEYSKFLIDQDSARFNTVMSAAISGLEPGTTAD
jgi:hypothetical protein